jgi:hypothetical protein
MDSTLFIIWRESAEAMLVVVPLLMTYRAAVVAMLRRLSR